MPRPSRPVRSPLTSRSRPTSSWCRERPCPGPPAARCGARSARSGTGPGSSPSWRGGRAVPREHTTADRHAAEVERCTAWLRGRIADSLQLPAADLGDEVPLTMYGLDSLLTAVVFADVEDWLGVDLDPSAMPAQP